MQTETFFIPSRKRKASEQLSSPPVLTEDGQKKKKKSHYHYDGGVLIFDDKKADEKKGKEEEGTDCDVDIVFARSTEEMTQKKKDATVAMRWAADMYLEPVNVMHCVFYWLSQYVNYNLPESQWFNDHIRGLMESPIDLTLSSSQGIAHIHTKLPKYTLLIRMAGSNLHKLPYEYFVQRYHEDCVKILESTDYFLKNSKRCFLTRNTFGLKGELDLATFQHNKILSYFYEPSFHVITSYLIYVHLLLRLPHGRQLASFLPRIKHIRKPIENKRIQWDKVLSLNKENSNYAEKRAVFEQDLIELVQALSHLEVDKVVDEVTALWSKKATYVTDLIEVRRDAIDSQLY